MRELGTFAVGVGGMAWAALELKDEALAVIGLIGFAIAIFCAGYNWGLWKSKKENQREP